MNPSAGGYLLLSRRSVLQFRARHCTRELSKLDYLQMHIPPELLLTVQIALPIVICMFIAVWIIRTELGEIRKVLATTHGERLPAWKSALRH